MNIHSFEVIFTSSDGDNANTINVWNIQTGTNLMTYKNGGICAIRSLGLLGSEYVIAAEKNKPLLKVWPVNSQLPLNNFRLLCPGIVNCVAVNPDKCHIAISVQEKLHVYLVSSGKLLGTGASHFQPIKVMKWSSDGFIIVCGGEDGQVTVWLISTIICKEKESEPMYIFCDHSAPVTDIEITPGGLKAQLITVSRDRTSKIYDLRDGLLLLTVIFEIELTAVCSNIIDHDIFVGANNGEILQINQRSFPRTKEYHLNTHDKRSSFIGHNRAITCLSVSLDGELLLSGSNDFTVKVWQIASKQCLKILQHKGQITNAFFTVTPKQSFNNELKPSIHISNFMKSEPEDNDNVISVYTKRDLIRPKHFSMLNEGDCITNNYSTKPTKKISEHAKQLSEEIESLKSVNKQMFFFLTKEILEKDKKENSDKMFVNNVNGDKSDDLAENSNEAIESNKNVQGVRKKIKKLEVPKFNDHEGKRKRKARVKFDL
uniref:Uncharacterized protein n=1 Tax=Clastoptera arizonana TaxID=38151 RepID=A0A1B6C927_9HEMI